MKGVTYTQVAQYVVLVLAYTVPAIFISLQLTGVALPPLGLFSEHSASGLPLLTKLDQVVTELGFNSYTEHNTNTLNMVLFTLSLMIGTAGLPHVIMRFFTVPKVSDARWSAGWGAGVHRAGVPDGSGGRCHGTAEPDGDGPARRHGRRVAGSTRRVPTG